MGQLSYNLVDFTCCPTQLLDVERGLCKVNTRVNSIFVTPVCRYQPDGALEQRAGPGEREYLTSEGGESDLTESESHLNMLKGGSSTLQAVLQPPSSPSEHSSGVVKMSICVLGRPVQLWCP